MLMVASWDGTLSSTEFYVAASTFSEQWRKFNSSLPQWAWIPSLKRPWVSHNHQVGYLSLENLILPKLSEGAHRNCDLVEKEECCSEYEDDVVDTAVVEHPELGRPWYTLHPCGTSEWMKLLLSSDGASVAQGGIPVEKYLVSWFSVVGQVFGIKLPFEMLNLVGSQ